MVTTASPPGQASTQLVTNKPSYMAPALASTDSCKAAHEADTRMPRLIKFGPPEQLRTRKAAARRPARDAPATRARSCKLRAVTREVAVQLACNHTQAVRVRRGTRGEAPMQVTQHTYPDRSNSQADSASSILVTRSTKNRSSPGSSRSPVLLQLVRWPGSMRLTCL